MEMTDNMRLRCDKDLYAVGYASGILALNVRWKWLAFPAAVVGLTGVFLGLAIVESRKKTNMLWRDHVLSLLFHTSGDDMQRARRRSSGDLGLVERQAKRTMVQLEQTNEGCWVFDEK